MSIRQVNGFGGSGMRAARCAAERGRSDGRAAESSPPAIELEGSFPVGGPFTPLCRSWTQQLQRPWIGWIDWALFHRQEPGQLRGVAFDVAGQFLVESGAVIGADVFLECGFIAVDLEDKVLPGILFPCIGKEQLVARFPADVLGSVRASFPRHGLRCRA